jgi:formylglycine-generating enzyme
VIEPSIEGPPPKFTISPATRAALIISGFFVSGILLTTFWVAKEALRIKRQRDATVAANNPLSGEMVWIPGGTFTMGANDGHSDEQPLHNIKLEGFYIDKTEVTNEQFARFVEATGYVTVAERPLTPGGNPSNPPVVAGALIFEPPAEISSLADEPKWWKLTPGANWQHPEGPQSNIVGREKHPVVQVCWEDTVAYAKWSGKRLPTEAEWEYAARGGLEHHPYVWGREKLPPIGWMANIWQGAFPHKNLKADGFAGTAPVASFPSNGFGLFDMSGNVWEWCADGYAPDYYHKSPRLNPKGPDSSTERVKRGGSFLSSDIYSGGYRPSGRAKNTPSRAFSDTGFRCARSAQNP